VFYTLDYYYFIVVVSDHLSVFDCSTESFIRVGQSDKAGMIHYSSSRVVSL